MRLVILCVQLLSPCVKCLLICVAGAAFGVAQPAALARWVVLVCRLSVNSAAHVSTVSMTLTGQQGSVWAWQWMWCKWACETQHSCCDVDGVDLIRKKKTHAGLSAIFSYFSSIASWVFVQDVSALCSAVLKISPLPLFPQHLLQCVEIWSLTPICHIFLPSFSLSSPPLYLVSITTSRLPFFSQVFNPSIQSRVLWCN